MTKIIKVYVAGKYQDRDRVRFIQRILQEQGNEITLDWTNQQLYPPDKSERWGEYAQADVGAIKRADLFIALMTHDDHYRGVWVEMGLAISFGIPIYIIGEAEDTCIFTHLPQVKRFKEIVELPNQVPSWCPLPDTSTTLGTNKSEVKK